ncbi:MAG: hypothetical protein AAF702_39160 [Chloroflexota bacterium]
MIGEGEVPVSGEVVAIRQQNGAQPFKESSALLEGGEYTIDGLIPGAYKLAITAQDDSGLQVDGIYSLSNDDNMTKIQVESGQTTANINMSLPYPQFDDTIRGTVTNNGEPLSNIKVEVFGGYPAPASY